MEPLSEGAFGPGTGAAAPPLRGTPRPSLSAALRVLLYLLAFVLLEGMIALVTAGLLVEVGSGLPPQPEEIESWIRYRPVALAVQQWASLGLLLALTALFVRGLDRRPWSSLGFSSRPAALAQVGVGFALGGLTFATVFVAGWLAGWYRIAGVLPSADALRLSAASLAILIPAAASEELVMRGYVLQALEPRYGTGWALGISSGLFAVLHAANPNASGIAIAGIFVAGLSMGIAYLLTRRLWLPIAEHVAWNFFEGPVFGFPVSGLVMPASILHTEARGPTLWTGGAFGPEAGLLAILVTLAFIALLPWATRPFRSVGDGQFIAGSTPNVPGAMQVSGKEPSGGYEEPSAQASAGPRTEPRP